MREGTADKQWQGEALQKMQQLESTGKLPPIPKSKTIRTDHGRGYTTSERIIRKSQEWTSSDSNPAEDLAALAESQPELKESCERAAKILGCEVLGQATADAMDPVDVYEPNNCEVEES
jgi:hypothetical protein